MESKLTLSFKNKDLAREYLLKRNAELIKVSLVIFSVRMLILLISVILVVIVGYRFSAELWILSVFPYVLHGFVILLAYLIPTVFCPLHGPLVVLAFFSVFQTYVKGPPAVELTFSIMLNYFEA